MADIPASKLGPASRSHALLDSNSERRHRKTCAAPRL